jgi:hypothetical protein
LKLVVSETHSDLKKAIGTLFTGTVFQSAS